MPVGAFGLIGQMIPDTADGLCWHAKLNVWGQREVESGRIDERLHNVESLAHLVGQAHRTDLIDVAGPVGMGGCFVTVTRNKARTAERTELTHGRDRAV